MSEAAPDATLLLFLLLARLGESGRARQDKQKSCDQEAHGGFRPEVWRRTAGRSRDARPACQNVMVTLNPKVDLLTGKLL